MPPLVLSIPFKISTPFNSNCSALTDDVRNKKMPTNMITFRNFFITPSSLSKEKSDSSFIIRLADRRSLFAIWTETALSGHHLLYFVALLETAGQGIFQLVGIMVSPRFRALIYAKGLLDLSYPCKLLKSLHQVFLMGHY